MTNHQPLNLISVGHIYMYINWIPSTTTCQLYPHDTSITGLVFQTYRSCFNLHHKWLLQLCNKTIQDTNVDEYRWILIFFGLIPQFCWLISIETTPTSHQPHISSHWALEVDAAMVAERASEMVGSCHGVGQVVELLLTDEHTIRKGEEHDAFLTHFEHIFCIQKKTPTNFWVCWSISNGIS